jgi:multiple sugar transport system permease protein
MNNPKNPVVKTMTYMTGYLFAILALFPLFWMFISGFKKKTEVLSNPFHFWPEQWLISNYIAHLQSEMFIRSMLLSFFGAIVFALGGILINSMAAYVFARLEFRYKKSIWVYVILTMFIPHMAILVTSFIVVTKLNMLDSLSVLIVPPLAAAASIFFIRQFYLNIPIAIEEAALIDGASRFGIYRHVFLPMSYPVFVIVGIGAFLAYFNSYIWPVVTITNTDLFQISQYLATFRSERTTEFGLLLSGATLAALPTIVLFLFFQKYIIQGIKISGLK